MPQNSRNATSATAFQFIISASSPFHSLAATISGHLNAGLRTARLYLSRSARLQLIDHFNRIFASAIFTLQSFLQLKYQWIHDQSQSPFSTHPIAMRVAVASSAVHYFAYAAVLRFPLHRLAVLAHHMLVSSGCVAVAALSSVFLPDAAAAFVCAVFGLLGAAELLIWLHWRLIEEEDEARRWRICGFINNLRGDLGDFCGRRMRRRLQV